MEKNENFKEQLETQYNILIKAKADKERFHYQIILIIVSVTLITAIIGTIFSFQAFKSSKNINNETKEEQKTYFRTLTTMFNNGSSLNLSKIGNGYFLQTPKIIQITNEGNADILFDIKLSSISTSLLSTNNLVYTLTRNDETSLNKVLPLTDKVILQDVKITPGETISYTLNAKFTGTIEQNNYSNYYNAKIEIIGKDDKSSLLE